MNGSLDQRDYARVERAIRFMDENFREQPALADVAAAAGLSSAHFSRMFTRWSGLSPMRYLRRLSLVSAQGELLREASVQDAAFAAGLSGPGRLHDLFVTIEAVTPGEYKNGGAAMRLAVGCGDTPFGRAIIARSPRGIVELGFLGERTEEEAKRALTADWPGAQIAPDPDAAALLAGLFEGTETQQVLHVRGTNFQHQVWRALLEIPEGTTSDYGRLAAAVGRPRAARAVGTALAANPVAWLIPCHRVLRRGGALGGYRWGSGRKRAILAWERCRREN